MKHCISFFLLLNICHSAFTQEKFPDSKAGYWNDLYRAVLTEYGFDQVLTNGICYEDYYRGKVGHPFLLDDQFHKGRLIFRNREYSEVNIKYDIYKQQVILYIEQNNSKNLIIPPNDFISAFNLENMCFIKYTCDKTTAYYQVVYDSEKLKCLYSWYKLRFDSDHKNNYNSSKFTDSKRKCFMVVNNVSKSYKNNKSFTKLFPQIIQVPIKEFLRNNSITVRKISDADLREVLIYCETLM